MAGLRKILLVEDNAELRDIYEVFLRANDFEVDSAYDGEMALERARDFQPDVVLLDVMMPKKDGFEVLQILRHQPEYNCTKAKIVLLTNLGDSAQVSPQVQADMDGYVIKSEIVLTDLLDIIKSVG